MKNLKLIRTAWAAAAVAAFGLLTAPNAVAADDVTVMLRSGEKVAGALEDLNQGTLYVRVSLNDQRKLPIGDVALIDFVGGASGLPESELSKARGDEHLLVKRDSSLIQGRLTDISGGEGSDKPKEKRLFIFRNASGEELRVPVAEVGRVYLGRFPGKDSTATPSSGDGVTVAANKGWVATGIYVAKGQQVTFDATGEVQLSTDAGDKATVAGSTAGRRATGSPLPNTLAGALVGRVGTNGEPFGIGNQTTAIPMPAAGELYLSVNDDNLNDNVGAFTVKVKPSPVSMQQRRRP